jgi:uncharacterized protein (DUF4415 family)
MSAPPPMTDDTGEIRELSDEALRPFRPSADLLDSNRQPNRRRGRGPQKMPCKQTTTIRLDADVLAVLRGTGPGWQTRVNDALREWLGLGTQG